MLLWYAGRSCYTAQIMSFLANYHTHTYRCKHASGDASDYAAVAAASGMKTLGFSDHTPLPDGRWGDMRMSMAQLDGYQQAVQQAKRDHPGLRILLGLECEFAPEYEAFYQEEILTARGFDYLIAGCHYTPARGSWRSSFTTLTTPSMLRAYSDYTIRSMASGLFAFVTHPDMFGCCNTTWTTETAACARDICQAAAVMRIPLELNAYGVRKPWIETPEGARPTYPWLPFWEVAAGCGVNVVISSDAHRPVDVAAGYPQMMAICQRFGLREADLSHLGAVRKDGPTV
jgi:histidinol-phosphatase (PHP family)